MAIIDDIKKPILLELELFTNLFVKAVTTDNLLFNEVNKYLQERSGKHLRPILTILSAKLCGVVNQSTIYGAHSIELLHTASLVHDDVVDDTLERRGSKSVNAEWTNKIAVFSGDYLFSKSLSYGTKTNNIEILKSISEIGAQLTDGELLQLTNKQISETSEENYFTVIRKKTAQLFSSCAEIGGLSVNASEIELEHLRNFGEYLGICFQIKDDIFDYFENAQIGKPTCNDLRDGKVTLPLIYALQVSSELEKSEILNWINKLDFTIDNIRAITQFTHNKGGITYSIQQMEYYKQKAIQELDSFEDSDVRNSLILYAEFAASREF
jgi:octaprenyl-diphosphate synthase